MIVQNFGASEWHGRKLQRLTEEEKQLRGKNVSTKCIVTIESMAEF